MFACDTCLLAFDGCLGFGLVALCGCGLVGTFLFVLSGLYLVVRLLSRRCELGG